MLKDLAIALSLANLCFLKVWFELFEGSYHMYFMKDPSFYRNFVAIVLNVMLLATVFWVPVTLARWSTHVHALNVTRWAFLLVIIVPLNFLRQQFPSFSLITLSTPLGKIGLVILGLVLAIFAVFMLVTWHHYVIWVSVTIVLVLFPVVLVTFSKAVYSAIKYYVSCVDCADKPLAPPLTVGKRSAPRVLWLLFDAMDQRLTFLERPVTIELPEIDRLRARALYANNAYSPAGTTLLSMPAFITGKLISRAQPVRPDELMITFRDSKEAVGWSTQPNIFSKAREAGFNTALVGWFHPYCRVIGGSLTTCSWVSYRMHDSEMTTSERMLDQVALVLTTSPLVKRWNVFERMGLDFAKKGRQEHIRQYLGILDHARRAAANPDLHLILVHWPIPHPPSLYNYEWYKDKSSYFKLLELVDRTLGELRSDMERANIWENTTVLITSDHPLYSPNEHNEETDHRVPFILKLVGQKKPVVYDPAFNTILIHDLLLALLHGELSAPESVVNWLDQHR